MKNRSWIGLLLAVVALTLLLLYQQGYFTAEGVPRFAIDNEEQVGTIFLADRSNSRLKLERKGKDWVLNDSVQAASYKVDHLLTTLRVLEVKRPISIASHNNVVRAMAAQNIKVELYDREGELMRSYYIGGPAPGRRGNYMRYEGDDDIYIVHIPGFEGMLHTRFSTTLTDWQDLSVFDYAPGTIEQVAVTYPAQPGASFKITVLERDSFLLQSPGQPNLPAGYIKDTRKIARYINQFRNINAEALINFSPEKDSILATTPFASIVVSDTSGQQNTVHFYRKAVDKRTKVQLDQQGQPVAYDLDRAYASINNGRDFVIVQYFVFGKLFRTYRSFFSIEV